MDDNVKHAPLPEPVLDAVAARFRLLGATSRLRILNALLDGPRSMSELQEFTGLEQSNLSRRVSELEAGGCLRRRREGRRVIVEVSDETLKELCSLVCDSLKDRFERASTPFLALSAS
jgi:DNA-binding transcriptional ArsR family regulator